MEVVDEGAHLIGEAFVRDSAQPCASVPLFAWVFDEDGFETLGEAIQKERVDSMATKNTGQDEDWRALAEPPYAHWVNRTVPSFDRRGGFIAGGLDFEFGRRGAGQTKWRRGRLLSLEAGFDRRRMGLSGRFHGFTPFAAFVCSGRSRSIRGKAHSGDCDEASTIGAERLMIVKQTARAAVEGV